MFYNRIGMTDNDMWLFQSEEQEILQLRIHALLDPESFFVAKELHKMEQEYNLFAWSEPLEPGEDFPADVPLLDMDNLADETREFVEKMNKSKENISNLLGNLPSIEGIKAKQEENKSKSLIWTDKLSTKEGVLARLCIGQEGIEGWSGIAILDDTWLMTIITPVGMMREPVLETWKDPEVLLQEFVNRNF